MADYRTVISKAATGQGLAELPLQGLAFSRVLSGIGSLSGALSVWHSAATEDVLGIKHEDPDRELTVFRNDIPVWNGPITSLDASMSSGVINITAREASWYLGKRVLEEDKSYTGEDVLDIVRDLVDYMETKEGTGDDDMTLGDNINAALPRFNVTAGTAGATRDASFSGAARHTIAECFDLLAADPETGFDWRMDYSTGSTRQSVQRTLTLGYPGLGTELTTELTQHNLVDFGRTCDWERAGNRVHVVGQGYTKTLQGAGQVADGVLLSEVVEDLTDTSVEEYVNAYAREVRRLSRVPSKTFSAAFIPNSGSLSFAFCDLGDTVPFAITSPPVLSIGALHRRVVQIDVTPGDDGAEIVNLTFNVPLDELGD